jgi:hypothetical protein
LRFDYSPIGVAVDGGRAATAYGGVLRWSLVDGSQSRRDVPCDTEVYAVALAGNRDAALCHEELNSGIWDIVNAAGDPDGIWMLEQDLDTATGRTRADLEIAGGGSLLVASVDKKLVRLDPGRHVTMRIYPRHARLFNVDGGRVLVQPRPGRLELLSASGAVLAALDVNASSAVLRGDRPVTLRGRELAVRDLGGKVLMRRTVTAGTELQDYRDGVVVYRTVDDWQNRLHLVRLSDGRDVTLVLRKQ